MTGIEFILKNSTNDRQITSFLRKLFNVIPRIDNLIHGGHMWKVGRIVGFNAVTGYLSVQPVSGGSFFQIHCSNQLGADGKRLVSYSIPPAGTSIQYQERSLSTDGTSLSFKILDPEKWLAGWEKKMQRSRELAARAQEAEVRAVEARKTAPMTTSATSSSQARGPRLESRLPEKNDEPAHMRRTYYSKQAFEDAFDDYWEVTRNK